MSKRLIFKAKQVDRRFTEEWAMSGFINVEKLPDIVSSVIEQRRSMLEYIAELQDQLDWILKEHGMSVLEPAPVYKRKEAANPKQ